MSGLYINGLKTFGFKANCCCRISLIGSCVQNYRHACAMHMHTILCQHACLQHRNPQPSRA